MTEAEKLAKRAEAARKIAEIAVEAAGDGKGQARVLAGLLETAGQLALPGHSLRVEARLLCVETPA